MAREFRARDTGVAKTKATAIEQQRESKTDAQPGFMGGGKLLRGIRLKVNTTTQVAHGLGRKPVGFWMVHASDFNTLGYLGPDPCREHTTEHLYVRCEGWAPKVDLIVI